MPDDVESRMQESTEAVARAGKPVSTITNIAADISPKAARPATGQPVPITDEFGYDVAFNVAIIGSGQAGARMADALWRVGYRRVCVFNTTDADFNGLNARIPRLSLDTGGASKDTELARRAMSGRGAEVHELMTRAWGKSIDVVLVCAGLGGGTGSGTSPELVQISRKYMEAAGRPVRVGAIVSLPTITEGYQVCRNAVNALQTLVDLKLSPLVLIDNARINQLYKPAILDQHQVANNTTAKLFHLFNQLAAVHSEYITFDRSELAKLLDSGLVTMAACDIEKFDSPADVSEAIRVNLTGNVLAQMDLKRGKKAACLFVGSKDVLGSLSLDYFEAGFTALESILGESHGADKPTVLHRGLYVGSSPGLQAYVMIGDLEPPRLRLTELAKKGGLDPKASRSIAEFLGVSG